LTNFQVQDNLAKRPNYEPEWKTIFSNKIKNKKEMTRRNLKLTELRKKNNQIMM
jgi:hypothetical protein